ncbi:MAG TPA: helix-turn-helix domain-containing protein, partial [Gemmatimonadales bacterium]|nr:helix-turn-helix domain-containing protein [Gemmatimonadales bacterium]
IPFIGDQKDSSVETTTSEPASGLDIEGPPGESYHAARERLLSAFERRYLTRLVQQAGGNMSKAARIAGVDRTTLYRLMERHGLERNLLATAPE